MNFIKHHWFAILFDLFLWLSLVYTNPNDLFNLFLASFFVLIIIGVQMLYHRFKKSLRRLFNKEEKQQTLTEDMKNHYHDKGLSEEETTFFRQTMATTKEDILSLEQEMKKQKALNLINSQTKVISAAKGIFRELVQEPKKLHMMGDFLYTYLPNLLDLCQKYNEVCDHELKNERTAEALNQSIDTIRHLSLAIVNEYNKITSDDLKALSEGIDLAQRHLDKQLDQKEILK